MKFALVAMWFMHLKFDAPTYARFFLMGLAGAATLYLVVLISFGIFLGSEAADVAPRVARAPRRLARCSARS